MKCKIAVVQMQVDLISMENTLQKAERFIRNAARAKANIVVFPEGSFFARGEKKTAEASHHIYLTFLQGLAKKFKIDIVTGSVIEKRRTGTYNTAYYIDARGKVLGKHRKINLWHPERGHFARGSDISVFQTKYGKVGLIICWDMMFPEVFRCMTRRGVQIIFCPTFWFHECAGIGVQYDWNADVTLVDAVSISRAFEHEIVFVMCNAAGKWTYGKSKGTLFGHSQITVPFRGCMKKLNHNREEMFVQEIDTSILNDAEKVYRIRKDLKQRIL